MKSEEPPSKIDIANRVDLATGSALINTATSAPVSTTTNTRQRSVSYSYLAVFVALGMFASIIGPSLDEFKERTKTTNGQIAVLFALMALGYICGGTTVGRIYDRRPGNPIMAGGALGSVLMIAALTQASTLFMLGAVMVILGAATSVVDTGGNTLLSWVHGERLGPWMIALHAAFGVGAALTPLILYASRRYFVGLNAGFMTIAIIGTIAAATLLRQPSPTHAQDEREAENANAAMQTKPAPNTTALLVAAAFFFTYVGLEVGFGGWVYTFATDRGFTKSRGLVITSVFWWSFTAGRILGIPIARVLSAYRQILFDVAITTFGAVVLVLSAHRSSLVWIGTVLLGLGLATMFPAMINIANERVAVTGSVTSWFIGGAGFGTAALPWLIGRLFDRNGSKILPGFVLIMTGVVALASTTAARLFERTRSRVN